MVLGSGGNGGGAVLLGVVIVGVDIDEKLDCSDNGVIGGVNGGVNGG